MGMEFTFPTNIYSPSDSLRRLSFAYLRAGHIGVPVNLNCALSAFSVFFARRSADIFIRKPINPGALPMIIASVLLSFVGGIFFAEVVGYFTHILLHSEKVPALSRGHMIHHLKVYGPRSGLRNSGEYRGSTENRASVLGIGLEWIAPLGAVTALASAIAWYFEIPLVSFALFVSAAIGWGILMFSYMHDAMHIQGFWMERSPIFKNWFRRVRAYHDIHHLEFSDDGRMRKNYGICLFFMDGIGRSLSRKHKAFNKAGFEAALIRYKDLIAS